MKKVFIGILSLIIAIIMLSSCEKIPVNADNDPGLKIVTTIFPIYDWVKNITGDANAVSYLDESGIDLHSFEPTAKDILALSGADMFVYIGGASDEWAENAVKASQNPSLITVSLIEKTGALEEETVEGMEKDDDDGELDEHIWLSLKKAQKAVNAITEALCEADTANADKYRANADHYIEKLSQLDSRYTSAVSGAKRNTLLFADRFPFRYMTEDYGLEYFAAFPGCSAESEASFETMAFLIEKTKELSLPDIIVIDTSDGRIASAVSEDTGAGILTLNSCQSVTKSDIENGMTYLSAMEENLRILTEALN